MFFVVGVIFVVVVVIKDETSMHIISTARGPRTPTYPDFEDACIQYELLLDIKGFPSSKQDFFQS